MALFEVKLLVFSGTNKKRSRKELSQELALKLTFGNKYRQKKKKQWPGKKTKGIKSGHGVTGSQVRSSTPYEWVDKITTGWRFNYIIMFGRVKRMTTHKRSAVQTLHSANAPQRKRSTAHARARKWGRRKLTDMW